MLGSALTFVSLQLGRSPPSRRGAAGAQFVESEVTPAAVRARVASSPAVRVEPDRSAERADARSPAPAVPLPSGLALRAEHARGHVRDALGGAIAGAQLSVDDAQRAVTSAPDGSFELPLQSGPHWVRVHAEGYSRAMREIWAPSSGADVVLAPAASLIGRVLETVTGTPVEGATIVAFHTSAAGAPDGTARSAVDGSFSVESLSGGRYAVRAEGEDWSSEWQSVDIDMGEQAGPLLIEATRAISLRGRVSVAGFPCEEGVVALSGPVTASGPVRGEGDVIVQGLIRGSYRARIHCDQGALLEETIEVAGELLSRSWNLEPGLSVQGVVVKASGAPAAGVEVIVSAPEDERSSARCATDERGEFSCAGLLAGAHDCWLASSPPTPGNVKHISLTVAETARVQLVQPARGSIRVKLRGISCGDPSSTAMLAASSETPSVIGRLEAGGIRFDDLALGTYQLFFIPANRAAARVSLEHDGQILELALEEPARTTLEGRVLDGRDQPIVEAWVRAKPAPSPAGLPAALTLAALTDERGSFSLERLISDGGYDVSVSSPQGDVALAGVRAVSGQELLIRVPTGKDGSVRGD